MWLCYNLVLAPQGLYMSKKQIITALAKRFADRRYAGSTSMHTPMMKAACAQAIVQHAGNWLAQHGALPEGEHVCRLKAGWGKGVKVTVDFTRLMANEPGYPESVAAEARRVHSLPS